MTRGARICALLTLTLLATGCGERSEPVGALPQSYPVTVQGAGDRTTEMAKRPERIVALDAGAAETLKEIGAGDRLVGVPAGLAKGDAADADVVVRSTGQVDIDGVIDLEPDLIVATPGIDQLDLARAERETGAAVYVQPEVSIESVQRGIIDLGFLVGEAAAARQLVGEIDKRVTAVTEQWPARPPFPCSSTPVSSSRPGPLAARGPRPQGERPEHRWREPRARAPSRSRTLPRPTPRSTSRPPTAASAWALSEPTRSSAP